MLTFTPLHFVVYSDIDNLDNYIMYLLYLYLDSAGVIAAEVGAFTRDKDTSYKFILIGHFTSKRKFIVLMFKNVKTTLVTWQTFSSLVSRWLSFSTLPPSDILSVKSLSWHSKRANVINFILFSHTYVHLTYFCIDNCLNSDPFKLPGCS